MAWVADRDIAVALLIAATSLLSVWIVCVATGKES